MTETLNPEEKKVKKRESEASDIISGVSSGRNLGFGWKYSYSLMRQSTDECLKR